MTATSSCFRPPSGDETATPKDGGQYLIAVPITDIPVTGDIAYVTFVIKPFTVSSADGVRDLPIISQILSEVGSKSKTAFIQTLLLFVRSVMSRPFASQWNVAYQIPLSM